MKSKLFVCGSLFVLLGASASAQGAFLAPPTPAGNPVDNAKTLLGMALFWEEQLSSSNMTACGTCHIPEAGGTDPRAHQTVHPGPDGVLGTPDDIRGSGGVPDREASGRYLPGAFAGSHQVTKRKAPTTINAAYLATLFYDGRVASGVFRDPDTDQVLLSSNAQLENLALHPLLDPVEMGHAGRTLQDVVTKLRQVRPLALAHNLPHRLQQFLQLGQGYDQLFEHAFGAGNTVSAARIAMAIATYLRTQVADQSPHDLAMRNLYQRTPSEERGFQLFQVAHGQAAACNRCHVDVNLNASLQGPTMRISAYSGLPVANSHNIGIRPVFEDPGVGTRTNRASDMGRFRTPQLRNVALHATFFHNGGAGTLRDVVEFYNRGGDFHVGQAVEIRPRNLTSQQVDDLVAFLQTLTDPRVAAGEFPFERPMLASESRLHQPILFGGGSNGPRGQVSAVAMEPVYLGARQATIAVHNVTPNQLACVAWDLLGDSTGVNVHGVQIHLGMQAVAVTFAGLSVADLSGKGLASMSFNLPSHPALTGTPLCAQWLVAEPSAPLGLVASNAMFFRL